MDDKQIIDLYWARSESAIAETDKKYGKLCHRIAFNILADPRDSEECVSDTYLKAWSVIPPKRPVKLSAFLGKITRNLALNRYEKDTAGKRGGGEVSVALDELAECIGTNENPETAVEQEELVRAVRRLLEKLPVRDRNVFVRRYFFMDSTADIAARFALKESNVLMILSRVRSKLRMQLIKEGYV